MAQSDYKESKWSVGLFAGYERNMFVGNVTNFFTATNGINSGCEFTKNHNYRFGLSGAVSSNKVINSFLSPQRDIELLKGQKANFTLIEVYAGKIYKQKNGSFLTPTVGVTVNEFTLNENEPDSEGGILTGYSPNIGVEYDYVFAKSKIKYKYDFQLGERADFFVKSKFLVNVTNFKSGFNGLTFSTKVVVGFSAISLNRMKKS